MRTLSVNTFLTLDGVMQAPGGPEEDRSGGFQHGGWSAGYWDDEMGQIMDEYVQKPFDLLLGRKTYEIFAAYWPFHDDSMGRALNNATKWVASKTLTSLEWEKSNLIKGDAGEGVKKLKEQSGPDIQVHGSANLIQTLLKHNLIDQFNIWTFPAVVGGGKRLFADGTMPAGLKLTESRHFSTGVVLGRYEPAGAIKSGSFADDEPTAAEVKRREKVAAER
jgi:dihydrofolate reductase